MAWMAEAGAATGRAEPVRRHPAARVSDLALARALRV